MSGSRWNRTGRRSGGPRKFVIPIPRPDVDATVYRQCVVCAKVVPPYDESCAGCQAIRKLKEGGKIE